VIAVTGGQREFDAWQPAAAELNRVVKPATSRSGTRLTTRTVARAAAAPNAV
jgi:hypothetical protein